MVIGAGSGTTLTFLMAKLRFEYKTVSLENHLSTWVLLWKLGF